MIRGHNALGRKDLGTQCPGDTMPSELNALGRKVLGTEGPWNCMPLDVNPLRLNALGVTRDKFLFA